MKETIDDILTELSCKGWQEAVHEIEKALEEKNKEIERLNNIISNMEEELMLLYLDFVEFNVDKAKEEIRKLKGVDKE